MPHLHGEYEVIRAERVQNGKEITVGTCVLGNKSLLLVLAPSRKQKHDLNFVLNYCHPVVLVLYLSSAFK